MNLIPLQPPVAPAGRIKAHVNRRATGDPLDALLGPHYAAKYSPRALRQAVSPHSLQLVVLSRYYPPLKLVVDFETTDRPFYPEEKRRWCHSQGLIYVAIHAHENLSVPEFQARMEAERTALNPPATPTDSTQTTAADTHTPETVDAWLQDPAITEGIAVIAAGRVAKRPNLFGFAATKVRDKQIKDLTEALRNALLLAETAPSLEGAKAWVLAQQELG